jgi:hypothetical protein
MPKRRDPRAFHRPEPTPAPSEAGADGANHRTGGGDSGDRDDVADIQTPRSTGTVGNVGNGSGGVAEPAREPRRMMPPSSDDLDVPDFLK